LGALTLEAVRQQQHQTAQPLPLVFSAADKLVDDDLRDVDEVSELRFPNDQPLGAIQAVAPLEAEYAGLAERTVVQLEPTLVGRDVAQRHELCAGVDVVDDRVAMREGAALDVLSGH